MSRLKAGVAVLAATVFLAAVAFSSSRSMSGTTELLPQHGAGGNIVSEVSKYADAFNAARNAFMSVGSGITSGIFSSRSAKSAKDTAVAQKPASAPEPTTTAVVAAANSAPAQADPSPAVAHSSGTQIPAAHAAAAAVKSARHMLRKTSGSHATRPASDADTAPAAEAVGHKMDGKAAVSDIDSYFDAMPTTDVNAFHEPTKNVRHFGRHYGSDKSRAELDDYFNRLAKDVHHVEYPAKQAVKELTDYYAKLPTKDVTADHNPASKKPAKKDFKDTEAYKDIGKYFDQIPVKKVNPFHEAGHGEHKASLPKYPASVAVKELDDYYSDLPVKKVNAFHQKSENLANEERAASAAVASLRRSTSAPRPNLSAAETVRESEVKPTQPDETEGQRSVDAEEQVQPLKAASEEVPTAADKELVSWQEVDNRRVYDKAAPSPKPARAQFRTVKDDTSFRHTTYEKVPGTDGRAARHLARDEKNYERHLRRKTRNWAALSDEQGRDADAPKLSEAERHAGGYDTQYGMTDRLGSKVIESTPEGDVITHLVSRKYAKAFPPSVKPEGLVVEGKTPAQVSSREEAHQAQVQQQPAQEAALPGPVGNPAGVVKGNGKLQMKRFRKYAPTPYWRLINRKGPQEWHAGKKIKTAEREFASLKPKEQAKLLAHMQKSAWWRKQHSKRVAAMEQAQAEQAEVDAVRGPAVGEAPEKAQGLRGRGMQALAQQEGGKLGRHAADAKQQVLAAAPRRHKGMAEVRNWNAIA